MDRLKKVYDHFSREIHPSPSGLTIIASFKEIGKSRRIILPPSAKGHREMAEEDPYAAEICELRDKVQSLGMPEKIEEIAFKEINRLERMNPISAEYTVSRTYVDYLMTIRGIRRRWITLTLPALERS